MLKLLPLLLLAACASGVDRTATEGFPLTFDKRLEQAGFPAPSLVAEVNGQPVVFMLDTMGKGHTLATWALGEIKGGQAAQDGAWEAELSAQHHAFGKTAFIVMQKPPEWEQSGMGGALVPQLLGERSWALDFKQAVLRPGTFDHWRSEYKVPDSATASTTFCGHTPVFAVEIDGQPVRLLMHTGLDHTLLKSIPNHSHNKLKVRAGGRTFKRHLHQRQEAPSGCAVDGFLGMDVLKRCVVLMSPGKALLHCP